MAKAKGGQREREGAPRWGAEVTALAGISTPYVDILNHAQFGAVVHAIKNRSVDALSARGRQPQIGPWQVNSER